MECPWGQKAFTGYLGSNKDTWKAYDSCQLLKTYSGPALNILVDQVRCLPFHHTATKFYHTNP